MILREPCFKLNYILFLALLAPLTHAQYQEEPWPDEINPPVQIVERGQDHAVYRQIKTISDASGSRTQTNQFTSSKTAFITSKITSGTKAKISWNHFPAAQSPAEARTKPFSATS